MNHTMFPPPKKPRLDIQYGGPSQVPVGQGTQAMDLGDDWEDDENLFIEAAHEFDKLIALSQKVPQSNIIIHPTGQQNSEIKPFPTKLSTVHFPESPRSSRAVFTPSNGGSASKFQKSKSFNLDQIASNFENKSNGVCSKGTDMLSETSIKQSELYKTKCGENEILQKQIKNLTANLHESKTRQRQVMLEKDREKTLLKEEMEQKLEELKSELNRLNTELLFQKNHITSTEFRTKELKNVRLKEPESPNSPSVKASAWKSVDELNSSFSRGGGAVQNKTSPLRAEDKKFKSPHNRPEVGPELCGQSIPDVDPDTHFGYAMNNIIGEQLLQFKQSSENNSSSVVNKCGSDLVQLVTCQSFLTSKAKRLISNILSSCSEMLSTELSHLQHSTQSEDKGESSKRDYVLSKSCFSVLPSGITYDLLQYKKLFDSEEGSELRRCVQLIAVLCSLSSYALSVVLNVPLSYLFRDNSIVNNLESFSSTSTNESNSVLNINILHSLNILVTDIATQNRTKCYNGVLLSVSHLMLTIFHQKLTMPDNTLLMVTSIIKDIILSRPGPAVLQVCVSILAESTYSSDLTRYLCGQSEMSSCRTSIVSNSELLHSFTPHSCAIHVLCTYLELFHPTSSLIRAYLIWILRLLALGKTRSVRDSNSVPCHCMTEAYHLFLVMAWTSLKNLCAESLTEESATRKHEIRDCVELAYQALYKLKQDKHLQFLQREGIYEALVLRLKTSNLNINLADKVRHGLTLDSTRVASPLPNTRHPNQVRSVICGDDLDQDLNDLDVSCV